MLTPCTDLICKTSRFFKDRLQKHRKPVISTDECSICAETLDPSTQDISFCVKVSVAGWLYMRRKLIETNTSAVKMFMKSASKPGSALQPRE
jgi:hypothetical protein